MMGHVLVVMMLMNAQNTLILVEDFTNHKQFCGKVRLLSKTLNEI